MNTFGAFKVLIRELSPLAFMIIWFFTGLATFQQMIRAFSFILVLTMVLVVVNALAILKMSNTFTKAAIGGNTLMLVYALTSVNISEHSIFLSIVFITTIYFLSPYLRTENGVVGAEK